MKEKGFTQLQNKDIFNSKISDGEFRIYAALKSYKHGSRGKSYPSQKLLADRLGKGERTIRRHVKTLKEQGKITIKSRGRKSSNLYEFPDIQADKSDLSSRSIPADDTGQSCPPNNTKSNYIESNNNGFASIGELSKSKYPDL